MKPCSPVPQLTEPVRVLEGSGHGMKDGGPHQRDAALIYRELRRSIQYGAHNPLSGIEDVYNLAEMFLEDIWEYESLHVAVVGRIFGTVRLAVQAA